MADEMEELAKGMEEAKMGATLQGLSIRGNALTGGESSVNFRPWLR